jgi:hypothetical protein
LEQTPDGLYRAKIFQVGTYSEVQFRDLAILDWSEYSEYREIKPLVLQAQCKFPQDDSTWFLNYRDMITEGGRLKSDIE